MSNPGEGIRERAVIEITAGIDMNIIQNRNVSFENTYAFIFAPKENKEDIKAFVEKQMTLVN